MTNHDSKDEDELPKSVIDIVASIEKIEDIKYPSIQSYLTVGDYFAQMQEGLSIVRRYQTAETAYDIAAMNGDLLHLAAIHVSVAELIGYLQGWARHAEDQRKIVKSGYAYSMRRKRDEIEKQSGITIKINDSEVDNFSRVLAKDVYIQAADAEAISRMMSQAWYAIGDFIKILNASVNRAHQELYTKT